MRLVSKNWILSIYKKALEVNSIERPKLAKHSALVLIVCGEQLLLQTLGHQGGEILDGFGTFVPDGENASNLIEAVVERAIGTGFRAEPFGTVTSFIEKPDASVELNTDVFRVVLTPSQKSTIVVSKGYMWAGVNVLKNDSRLREVDRKLFRLGLGVTPLRAVSREEQYGKWVDAKLLEWR